MQKNALKVTVGLAAIGLATAASAASIGVNFVSTGDGGVQDGLSDSLGAAEIAGVAAYAQGNWNNVGRWGQNVGLKDNVGGVSGLVLTWDSNNTWNLGGTPGTPGAKLMYGYLDATGVANNNSSPYQFWWNENKPQAYVSGLSAWLTAVGAPRYNVVVYTDGDAQEGRISEYWLQASLGGDPPNSLGSDLTPHVFAKDTANFSETFSEISLTANSVETAGEGNYFVFTGLSADNFILRTEEQTFRATINGFQIVAVPEPTALSLLAAGVGALLAGRKQRR